MTVFDSSGMKIGIVTHVTLKGIRNSIKSLEIKEGFNGKKYSLSSEYIAQIGENVMFNVLKKQIIPDVDEKR